MILQFDLGNTRLKWRLMDDPEQLHGALDSGSLESGLRGLPWAQISAVQVVSVADRALTEAVKVLSDSFSMPSCDVVEVDLMRLPAWFSLGDTDHAQIGADRVMAMLGAYQPQTQYCVIDAGTALTADLVADGQHLGGYIVPGLRMALGALGAHTARIGSVGSGMYSAMLEPGRNTQHAVEHGVRRGLIAFCQAVAEQLSPRPDRIVVTGGDAAWISGHLHGIVVTEADLVFQGLTRYFSELS